VGPEAPFLHPALLRWKFWEPREDHSGPRGFVIERDGRIAAHVGLWPVTVKSGAAIEEGVHLIDWASDPQTPGAGVSLVQRMTRMHDFVYAMGGSDASRSVLAQFGFRRVEDVLIWARPLRPWVQIRHHQRRDWRLPSRLLRNSWWARSPRQSLPAGWVAARTSPGESAISTERPPGFFRYLERCPSARLLTFGILHDGRMAGSFALTDVQGQARLAGIWLESPSAERWRIAHVLAQGAALEHTNCSEIVARGLERTGGAAGAAGLRVRGRAPAFLYRKSGDFDSLPTRFQIVDNDRVFWSEERPAFLT